MSPRPRAKGIELLLSIALHAALLLAFGAPLARDALSRPKTPEGSRAHERKKAERRSPSPRAERAGRLEASRRLERQLPRLTAAPPPERPLVILPLGAGTNDHNARATQGIPGLARPRSPSTVRGDEARLPVFEPRQLESAASGLVSVRRAEEQDAIQRPELRPEIGLFASEVSAGRQQSEAGRPSTVATQPTQEADQPAAAPLAPESAEPLASGSQAPPPGAELAVSMLQREASGSQHELERDQQLGQEAKRRQDREGLRREVPLTSSPRREAVAIAAFTLAARPDGEQGAPKAGAAGADEGRREGRQADEVVEARQGRSPEEAGLPAQAEHAEGLWVAQGRSEDRAVSGSKAALQRVAEGKPKANPMRLAMAASARAVGAGAPQSRLAAVRSDASSSNAPRLTSKEHRLGVEALEGGEEGARRGEESSRALASADRRLVGDEAPEAAADGFAVGSITIAPEGDGSGDEVGAAAVAGSGDMRHLVQERINFVTALVGPGITRRTGASGVGVVTFRVDGKGYVRAVRLERSTGSEALDAEIEAVLRLAEPYPGWRGWLRVAVPFSLPRIDY